MVDLAPRANSRPVCSGCGLKGPCYDHTTLRLFENIPILGFKVYYAYLMRRVDCSLCGVTIERVPWAEGKKEVTKNFEWFLAAWAKRLSWKETAEIFGTSWDTVFRAVEMAVL